MAILVCTFFAIRVAAMLGDSNEAAEREEWPLNVTSPRPLQTRGGCA